MGFAFIRLRRVNKIFVVIDIVYGKLLRDKSQKANRFSLPVCRRGLGEENDSSQAPPADDGRATTACRKEVKYMADAYTSYSRKELEYEALLGGTLGFAWVTEQNWWFLPKGAGNVSQGTLVKREELTLLSLTRCCIEARCNTYWKTAKMVFPTGRGSLGFNGAESRLIKALYAWSRKFPEKNPEDLLDLAGYREGLHVWDLKTP